MSTYFTTFRNSKMEVVPIHQIFMRKEITELIKKLEISLKKFKKTPFV